MSCAYPAIEETCTRRETPVRFAPKNHGAGPPAGKITFALALFLLFGMAFLFLPERALAASGARAQVSVGISVRFGPPPLPVYEQPMCPGPGYIWTPGYWNWDPNYGYFWVPGTWVPAPFVGALWTPGYWGWNPGLAVFVWHSGYWGTRVGFYGGINYGFGYFGVGYVGGYWRDRDFYYNRAVTRINVVNIRNVYERRVEYRNVSYVSYNGGRGGIVARPTREDFDAERTRRMGPIAGQRNQERIARGMPEMRWSENRGRPNIAATPRPEAFRERGISRGSRSGGPYTPGERRRPEGARPNGGPAPAGEYRGAPERGGRPAPSRNERPAERNQSQPQYRGERGRGQNTQGERGRGNQNRNEKRQERKDRGGPPERD
jgi:WXXGXW repeat (2 copies)